MPRVFSAVLEIDTRFMRNPHAAATLQEKLGYLRRSLRYAMRGFSQLNNGVAPSVAAGDILIFSAPEYYFASPQFDADASVFAYSETQAQRADTGCLQISTRYPDVLIVAGTVLYTQSVDRAERGRISAEMIQGKTRFLAVPEAIARMNAVKRSLEPKGSGRKSKYLPGNRLRAIGYNQARVYFNGGRAFTLNKIGDAREFVNEPGGKLILVPGTRTGVFDCPADPRYQIGLEICADHGNLETMNQTVDILIVIAAAIPLNACTTTVRPRGLGIHANASLNYQNTPSGMRRMKAPDAHYRVFDPDATDAKLLQAVRIHSVRCQAKTL